MHARLPVRRMLLAAGVVALLLAATLAVTVRTRPGSFRAGASRPYLASVIRPSAPQNAQDAAVGDYYDGWKSAFVRQECGAGTFQVQSPDAAYPYVAEAQGYGLIITASMADADPHAKGIFDGIVRYVVAHRSVNDPDLMAAEQNSDCADVGGGDSATDGDMDIAYALLLADRQWGSGGDLNYRGLALRRIAAIKRSEVNPRTKMMLLGDWVTPASALYNTSRTSDWIVHYFRAFRSVTGDRFWDDVRVAHQNAIASIQADFSPATGLLPDFVRVTDAGVEPVDGRVLESDHDGDYGFNACRTPWRIGLDALTSGDRTSLHAARKMNAWAVSATGGDPEALGTGYTLSGQRYGAGTDSAFWAPFAVAAMTDAGSQAWLDALWATMAIGRILRDRYFGSTIQLQAMIIVSGRYTPL